MKINCDEEKIQVSKIYYARSSGIKKIFAQKYLGKMFYIGAKNYWVNKITESNVGSKIFLLQTFLVQSNAQA